METIICSFFFFCSGFDWVFKVFEAEIDQIMRESRILDGFETFFIWK